ncbi:MAG: alpha/beta hydrolase [Janthinobacterium lividum]
MRLDTPNLNRPNAARRAVVAGGAIATASAMLSMGAFAASSSVSSTTGSAMKAQDVQFQNNGIKMAGIVFFPEGFSEADRYPSVIVVHPGGGVKEQTASVYAKALAQQGFVTLAFDASHRAPAVECPVSSMTQCDAWPTFIAQSIT